MRKSRTVKVTDMEWVKEPLVAAMVMLYWPPEPLHNMMEFLERASDSEDGVKKHIGPTGDDDTVKLTIPV